MTTSPSDEPESIQALGLETIIHIGEVRDIRAAILDLQEKLRMLPQGAYPLMHHFSDGQYAREIFIPKHSIVVGKIHRHSHTNVISLGDVTVVTEFGIKRLKAPLTFVSKPGTKRALITHEDTIWTTVHVTESRDIQTIEDQIIAPTYKDFDEIAFNRNLEIASKRILDELANDHE